MRAFDDGRHCRRASLHDRFDTAITAVAHSAADAQLLRLAGDVIAKPHTLHKATDRQVTGDGFTHV